MHRDTFVSISHSKLASAAHGLPLRDKVGKPFDVVSTVLSRVGVVRKDAFDRALAQRLLNVLTHGHPLQVVILLMKLRLGLDGILEDTLHEEESYEPVFDCLHLDEGVHIELLVKSKLGLFVYFAESAVFRRLPLVHLTLGEVKFAHDSIPRVLVHHEEKLVKSLVEDQCTVGGDLLLVKPVVFPDLAELVDLGLQIAPMLEDPLRKLLLVCVVARKG